MAAEKKSVSTIETMEEDTVAVPWYRRKKIMFQAKALFTFVMYLVDMISDLFNGVSMAVHKHRNWGILTIILTFVPNVFLGVIHTLKDGFIQGLLFFTMNQFMHIFDGQSNIQGQD